MTCHSLTVRWMGGLWLFSPVISPRAISCFGHTDLPIEQPCVAGAVPCPRADEVNYTGPSCRSSPQLAWVRTKSSPRSAPGEWVRSRKARDTRLDRIVAIKVLKDKFSERFEREARAVAAVNHPNIWQLYDVGPNYLVMELVEGTPLKGPLKVDKAVEYAGQILGALDAAGL